MIGKKDDILKIIEDLLIHPGIVFIMETDCGFLEKDSLRTPIGFL
tara:strand:- start:406 stop:540 length:135 start_codon:yes stop_codon:yes gene_type:complete